MRELIRTFSLGKTSKACSLIFFAYFEEHYILIPVVSNAIELLRVSINRCTDTLYLIRWTRRSTNASDPTYKFKW